MADEEVFSLEDIETPTPAPVPTPATAQPATKGEEFSLSDIQPSPPAKQPPGFFKQLAIATGKGLPAIGATVGGMAGGLTTGGAGAVPGAAGGAMIGEAIRQYGSAAYGPEYFGPAPATPLESISQTAQEGAFGAGAEWMGQAANKYLLNPAVDNAVNLYKKFKVTPTLGDVGGSMTRMFQNIFAKMPGGMGALEKARAGQAEEVRTAALKLLNEIGPKASPAEAGARIKFQLKANSDLLFGDRAANFSGFFSDAYTSLDQSVGAQSINAQMYEKAGDEALAVTRTVAGELDSAKPGISKAIQNTINRARNFARDPETGAFRKVTFGEAKTVRTELLDLKRSLPDTVMSKNPRSALDKLISTLDDTMEQTATKAGVLDEWRNLNSSYKTACEVYRDGPIADIINGEGSFKYPEDALVPLFKNKGKETNPKSLIDALGGDIFEPTPVGFRPTASAMRTGLTKDVATVRRQVLEDLVQTSAPMTSEGRVYAGDSIMKNWNDTIPQSVKDAYFTPTQQQTIREFGKLTSQLAPELKMGNAVYAWGGVSLLGGIGGAVGGYELGGKKGAETAGVSVLIGLLAMPAVGARIMASPASVKILTSGVTRNTAGQITAFSARALNLIRDEAREALGFKDFEPFTKITVKD